LPEYLGNKNIAGQTYNGVCERIDVFIFFNIIGKLENKQEAMKIAF